MNSIYLQSVGVVAPGLSDWPACRDVLTGRSGYQAGPIPRFNPDTLPVNERRRITPTIRIAMQAATEAIKESMLAPDKVATVFASSNGDLDISDRICNALTLPDLPVSPTDFHNSVHNAPAGYWAIGSHCRQSSTSLSAGYASFAAGMLETVTKTLSETHTVMLVAYDLPPPEALANQQTTTIPFAAALVISHQQTERSLGELKIKLEEKPVTNYLRCKALENMRMDNPAAQALLLLELVAKESTTHCVLPYLDSAGLLVEYTPC